MRNEITKRPVVCSVPGTESVWCLSDSKYHETADASLTFDVFYPGDLEKGLVIPAVLFVLGIFRRRI